jgi:DNA-binding IclR family transcriptional regulator
MKGGFMDIAIPDETENRMRMISNVFASSKHLTIFRALTRMDPWASVAQIVRKTKVSKRTVYRIVKDFRKAGILESKTISRRRVYRLAEGIKWVGTLIEEPKVFLTLKDVPEKNRLRQLLSEDKLARQVVGYLLDAPGPLTLRQLSAEGGAWAIEVKARLNRLIDEGLVLKRDLEYSLNRKVASELVKEVAS